MVASVRENRRYFFVCLVWYIVKYTFFSNNQIKITLFFILQTGLYKIAFFYIFLKNYLVD